MACFFKKKKSWTSSIKKIWVFHIKIQIWASLEKEMADPSSKGPPLPTQSKLGHPNHFITWTFYFLHSALPKLFTYVICSAYVSSLKNLSSLKEQRPCMSCSKLSSTLCSSQRYLKATQRCVEWMNWCGLLGLTSLTGTNGLQQGLGSWMKDSFISAWTSWRQAWAN